MENPSRAALTLAAVAGLALWGGIAGGQDPGAFLAPYRAAMERGQVGTLAGAAFLEPRRPQEAAAPLAGVTVVVLPLSPRLVADLEAVKTHARDSAGNYFAAAGEVRKIKDAYELALWQARAWDLMFIALTDTGGRFELARVPSGEWVLLAWHEQLHQRAPPRIPQREGRGAFVLEPLPSGYRAVTYWLLKLRVVAGEGVSVELHDRNPWLTAVVEEKTQGVIQKQTP